MPGYASWKQLYQEEYFQLKEEGYQIEDRLSPDHESFVLPFPKSSGETDLLSDSAWKEAYENLWACRLNGLRPDYPYQEPIDYQEIIRAAQKCKPSDRTPLSYESYCDRIAGAWLGRCAGVVLGKPLEMGYDRLKVQQFLESVNAYPLQDWVPGYSEKLEIRLREDCIPSTKGNVHFVQPDDDIHYTILALLLAEKHGLSFNAQNVGENWLDNIPYHWVWCASRQMYYHMVHAENESLPDMEALRLKWNPWRECIDGQIRGDFWGYICPGNPQKAGRLAYQECSNSLIKNGVYGAMFVAACISAALTESPAVDSILDGGLSVIPQKSRLFEAVSLVRKWYRENPDWITVCDRINETYGRYPFAGTINNLSMVVLALLHGQLDYERTITTAVMCGIDTDCNAGTAGSIVGAAIGLQKLDPRWYEPLNNRVKTAVAGFGEGQISDLVQRTVNIYLKTAEQDG